VAPELTVTPSGGSILGGNAVNISGLYFSQSQTIVMRIHGSLDVICVYLNATTATCQMPILYSLGDVNITISLDGGSSFPFAPATYTSEPLSVAVPLVTRVDALIGWAVGDFNTITWDASLLGDVNTNVNIDIWGFDPNFAGMYPWFAVQTVGTAQPNTGSYTFVVNASIFDSFTNGNLSFGTFNIRVSTPPVSLVSDIFTYIQLGLSSDVCAAWDVSDAMNGNVNTLGLPSCPCTLSQALQDRRNYVDSVNPCAAPFNYSSSPYGSCQSLVAPDASQCQQTRADVHCVHLRYLTPSGAGSECCYYISSGALVTAGDPAAGTVQEAQPTANIAGGIYPVYTNLDADVIPYLQCCVYSNNCRDFQARRPVGSCAGYVPPGTAGGRSVSEVFTFDNRVFGIYGLGDHWLMQTSSPVASVQVQSRTRYTLENPVTQKSSIGFTGVAIVAQGTSKVEVVTNGAALQVLIDGVPADLDAQTEYTVKGGTVDINCATGQVLIDFSALGVQLTVDPPVSGSLSFVVDVPVSFKQHVNGLFGNYDGNAANDITTATGSVLSDATPPAYIFSGFEERFLAQPQQSLFTELYSRPSNFVPNFSTSLSQCSPTAAQQITASCAGDKACLAAAAVNCDVNQAAGFVSQSTEAQMLAMDKIQPPSLVYTDETPLGISFSQDGGTYTFIRNFFSMDPQGLAITWTFNNSLGATFTRVNANSYQMTLVVTNQVTASTASIIVTVTGATGAASSLAVPITCVCGCPFGGFVPSVTRAPLNNIIPIQVPICAPTNTVIYCRFGDSKRSFITNGTYSNAHSAFVCNSPLGYIGGVFPFTVSVDGGMTYPLSGGNFTFSPTTVWILQEAPTTNVTTPLIYLQTSGLCSPDYCVDPTVNTTFVNNPYYNHGLCVVASNGNATRICTTNVNGFTTTDSYLKFSTSTQWAIYRPLSEIRLATLINGGSPYAQRRRQAKANNITVEVTGFTNNNGSMQLFFFAYYNGSTIPKSQVAAAIKLACAYNQDPSLVPLCGSIRPSQGASQNVLAVGSTNWLILVICACCLAIIIVVIVVGYKRKNNRDNRMRGASGIPSQAVSFENPHYATAAAPNASSEFYHEDDVLDATNIANFETNRQEPLVNHGYVEQSASIPDSGYNKLDHTQASEAPPAESYLEVEDVPAQPSTEINDESYLQVEDPAAVAPAAAAATADENGMYLQVEDPAAAPQVPDAADMYLQVDEQEEPQQPQYEEIPARAEDQSQYENMAAPTSSYEYNAPAPSEPATYDEVVNEPSAAVASSYEYDTPETVDPTPAAAPTEASYDEPAAAPTEAVYDEPAPAPVPNEEVPFDESAFTFYADQAEVPALDNAYELPPAEQETGGYLAIAPENSDYLE